MKEKIYQQLNERVITTVLPNGLKVIMVPKNDYHKVFAVLTASFGSLERQFSVENGPAIEIPAGTAHFLEHKLFEKADGDAFERFGELGADANAFTNAYQTSYYFSTAQLVEPALIHLLDFVQEPYFTNETVAKEQGIIGQEIQMYEDDSEWLLYMGLLKLLYPESALAEDIAGTKTSIANITPELLYEVHRVFYQPKQLTLQIVGNFDPEKMMALINQNQKVKKLPAVDFKTIKTKHHAIQNTSKVQEFDVVRPKIALGIRLPERVLSGKEATKAGLMADILLDMMFGEQTDWYQNLYNRSVIDNEFDTSFDMIDSFQFVSFFSETTAYNELTEAIQKQLDQYQMVLNGQEAMFESLKRATIGEGIQRLNSLEDIALRGDDILFGNNLFDKIMLIQDLTYHDILKFADEIYKNVTLQRFILKK